jgi:hypothetical protein
MKKYDNAIYQECRPAPYGVPLILGYRQKNPTVLLLCYGVFLAFFIGPLLLAKSSHGLRLHLRAPISATASLYSVMFSSFFVPSLYIDLSFTASSFPSITAEVQGVFSPSVSHRGLQMV